MKRIRTTATNKVKVLLIEHSLSDAILVKKALSEVTQLDFKVKWIQSLQSGIECIIKARFDVILLDLFLPDSQGIDTLIRIREHTQDTPIVVLTGMDDEQAAVTAVQHGAQDYLIKGQVNARLITRSLRYAIERHRLQEEMYHLTIMDDLTGLYNRRGFFNQAEQHLNNSGLVSKGFLVIVTDLDGMKQINDSYGHHVGDMALIDTSATLKEVFNDSAIIARMGGDEFNVILPANTGNELELDQIEATFIEKMNDKLTRFNLVSERVYKLSISLGMSRYNPDAPVTLGELIIQADHRMYSNKKIKL